MPPERRSLRSNKQDTSSSANGDKARGNSQNSSSNKDKPTPARSASTKTRAATAKKSASKNAGEEQPHTDSTDPVENGVNGTEDVEMKEDSPANGNTTSKQQKDNDGDEEMTVVVPATTGSKGSGSGRDKERDVAMDEAGNEAGESVEEVDPKTKAVAGMTFHLYWSSPPHLTDLPCSFFRHQEQFHTSRESRCSFRPQIYAPCSEIDIVLAKTALSRCPRTDHRRDLPKCKCISFVLPRSDWQEQCI